MHGIPQKVGILEFAMLSAGVHSRRAFSKVGGIAFGQSSRGGVRIPWSILRGPLFKSVKSFLGTVAGGGVRIPTSIRPSIRQQQHQQSIHPSIHRFSAQ